MAKSLIPVVVTVTDERLNDIQQVADQLAVEGLKVDQVLPVTGVIVGTTDPMQIPALEQVDGVMSVEDEVVAVLPPPDAPVQ